MSDKLKYFNGCYIEYYLEDDQPVIKEQETFQFTVPQAKPEPDDEDEDQKQV